MAGTARHHLTETGMSYGTHMKRAWRIGGALLVAGGACIVHGLLPGLFSDKATRTIVRLNDEMKSHAPKDAQPILLEFEI